MTITILDPGLPLPTPTLDKSGKLTASGLCTWLRCMADQSQRTGASDWRRAAEHYQAALLAELRERVDWKLISKARQARADRVAAEGALEEARRAIEDLDLPAGVPRSAASEREHRARREAVAQAERAMIAARTIERDAMTALSRSAMPVFCEGHDRGAIMLQEAQRAGRALVEDARHALRIIEQVDPIELLLQMEVSHDDR